MTALFEATRIYSHKPHTVWLPRNFDTASDRIVRQSLSHRRPAMPSFEPCLNASVRLIGCIN